MVGEDKVAEVRERTDIVALIGEHVALKRVGAQFRGLCPFHAEKTPSFYVHPARQFFHCFGCHVSGDVFAFIMRLEGRSFPEALRMLAERAGVELPESSTRQDEASKRERARRDRLIAVLDAAAGYFVRMLDEHPLSHLARAELARRQMRPETVATYRLGYAPHGWSNLAEYLVARGHRLSDAEEAGLVVPRRGGEGHYDRFRHRLMFPITDVHGAVVAFSGRALPPPPGEAPGDEPPAKYVNSPEGPLYRKGSLLFGLHEARVALRREGWALLCEGNFDVLAVHQAGFPNVVAPLGTAFTAEQARLLKRYVSRVVVLFDGDTAGRKATAAAAPLLRAAGLSASVVALPRGSDPDQFIREHGPDALRQRVASAPSMLEHLIDTSASDAGADPAARAAAIESLGPTLAAVDNDVERALLVERVAQAFQVADISAVRRALRRGMLAARRAESKRTRASVEREGKSHAAAAPREDIGTIPAVERDVVGCFLDQPEAFDAETLEILPDLLTSREMAAILRAARRLAAVSRPVVASSLLVAVEEEGVAHGPARRWLEERLAVQIFDLPGARAFLRTAMPLLRKQQIEREQRELMRKVQQALREGDEERATELMRLRDALFRAAGALARNSSADNNDETR